MSPKRKRSDSTSSPASTSSLFSRSSPRSEASNDSGRTMKRFRDNRPDERLIHESTLRRLYNAQREQPHVPSIPSQAPAVAEDAAPVSHQPAVQKSTLHKFWNIPQARSQQPPAASLPAASNGAQGARCEDCDASLVSEDSMDIDMDGCGSQQQFACNHCGRMVCGTCSISRDVRSCLNCAMT